MFISSKESAATGFKKWSLSHPPKQVGDEGTTAENSVGHSGLSSDAPGLTPSAQAVALVKGSLGSSVGVLRTHR
jgi:hypothetical protein